MAIKHVYEVGVSNGEETAAVYPGAIEK